MSVQEQQAFDSLYAICNVLTIKITMPQSDWDAVRTEQPAGRVCNFQWTGGSRYHAEEFSIVPFDTPDQFTFSGYFKLASIRTNLRATYGSADTAPASGRPRVYQDLDPNEFNLYLY